MNYELDITEVATLSIAHIIEWYEDKEVSLSNHFKQVLKNQLNRIKENPALFQEVGKEERRAVLVSPFPYSIYYLIDRENRIITIADLLHHSQNREIRRSELTRELKLEKRNENSLSYKEALSRLNEIDKQHKEGQEQDLDMER